MNFFWTFWGVISIHFRAFLKVKVQCWKMCFGLLNFKYFWGMRDVPYILWKRVDAGHKPTYFGKK